VVTLFCLWDKHHLVEGDVYYCLNSLLNYNVNPWLQTLYNGWMIKVAMVLLWSCRLLRRERNAMFSLTSTAFSLVNPTVLVLIGGTAAIPAYQLVF